MAAHEKILWPKGLKKTKQRVLVLDALCEAENPISAQELLIELERRGNPMWFSTVYRVLDTLLAHGIIQKPALRENGTAFYEINDGHKHYAVCIGCNRVIAIHGCPIESVMPDLLDKSFRVVGHKLQISGYCGDCHEKY